MPPEQSDLISPAVWTLLQALGFVSVSSFLSLWGAVVAFPPELVVESVVDPSKDYSSESRLKIKNTGKLPACNIRPEVKDAHCKFGGVELSVGEYSGVPEILSRLANSESAEIPITTGINISGGAELISYTYTLRLRYTTRLLFFYRSFDKSWDISLRKRRDGYSWIVANA